MSFYITLPSSVKLSGMEDNNTNFHYFTRLTYPLNLEGDDWEVGLTEITYPISLENVGSGEVTIKGAQHHNQLMYTIEPGQYITNYELIEELESRKREMYTSVKPVEFDGFYSNTLNQVPDVNFEYSPTVNKFSISIGEGFSVRLEGELAEVMGFSRGEWLPSGKHVSSFTPNLHGRNSLLYVYASFASPRVVGDIRAPLLRVFPTKLGERKRMVHKQFKQTHYIPVENLSTDLVEIDIRRDDGSYPTFRGGKVVLTVHFRKKPRLS